MSQAASPTNRGSIFGWVKNLKRGAHALSDSVNELDPDLAALLSRSPTHSLFHLAGQSAQPPAPAIPLAIPRESHHLASLRPLLSHKSRLTNNVNRIRSNSASNNSCLDTLLDIRQHRDSFLQNNPLIDENLKYFGVPLADAINQASARISILGLDPAADDENVLHYGKIPIVVAKCGVFLKNNGLKVEGIFRVGGSLKRIKELQIIFNTPPEFGKKLHWDGYTVHDAASVLRRYLNALPEPLIPLELYEDFRDPLRTRPRIIKYLKYKLENPLKVNTAAAAAAASAVPDTPVAESGPSGPFTPAPSTSTGEPTLTVKPVPIPQSSGELDRSPSPHSSPAGKPKSYKKLTRDVYEAIDDYKQLLDELPGLSKQLLFYILDLLAMVQNNSNENLMSSRNLAAIYQPSILLHPNHDMDPDEYALSQSVVEFLIQYAYKLLPSNESKSENALNIDTSSDRRLGVPIHGRQHSQSLSAPSHDVDLIGCRNSTKPAIGTALLDNEHEFGGTSSDDDEAYEGVLGLPKPLAVPNILLVVDSQNDADVRIDTVVPIVILDDSKEHNV